MKLSEWDSGWERAFLLLGNQGTGKNKICDRICQLANLEREYMQLHCDSIIRQLALSPTL
jgi:MoxR-like ATPase